MENQRQPGIFTQTVSKSDGKVTLFHAQNQHFVLGENKKMREKTDYRNNGNSNRACHFGGYARISPPKQAKPLGQPK